MAYDTEKARLVPPVSSTDAEWRTSILKACDSGDLASIKTSLAMIDDDPDIYFLLAMTKRLIGSGNSEAVAWFFQAFPHLPEEPGQMYDPHLALMSPKTGLDMYKVLTERCPAMEEWEMGHAGNHLGLAAWLNDIDFANYLIQRGAKASEAVCFTIYAIGFLEMQPKPTVLQRLARLVGYASPDTPVDRSAMIKLLKKHGAPTDKLRPEY